MKKDSKFNIIDTVFLISFLDGFFFVGLLKNSNYTMMDLSYNNYCLSIFILAFCGFVIKHKKTALIPNNYYQSKNWISQTYNLWREGGYRYLKKCRRYFGNN